MDDGDSSTVYIPFELASIHNDEAASERPYQPSFTQEENDPDKTVFVPFELIDEVGTGGTDVGHLQQSWSFSRERNHDQDDADQAFYVSFEGAGRPQNPSFNGETEDCDRTVFVPFQLAEPNQVQETQQQRLSSQPEEDADRTVWFPFRPAISPPKIVVILNLK